MRANATPSGRCLAAGEGGSPRAALPPARDAVKDVKRETVLRSLRVEPDKISGLGHDESEKDPDVVVTSAGALL